MSEYRKQKKFCLMGMGISFLIAIAPILSLFLGIALSFLFGCENVNEGSSPDCFFGDGIYMLMMMTWFIFFTFPFGMFACFLFLIAYLVFRF